MVYTSCYFRALFFSRSICFQDSSISFKFAITILRVACLNFSACTCESCPNFTNLLLIFTVVLSFFLRLAAVDKPPLFDKIRIFLECVVGIFINAQLVILYAVAVFAFCVVEQR